MPLPTDAQRAQARTELLVRLWHAAEAHPEGIVVNLSVLHVVGWATSDDRRLFDLEEARVIRDSLAEAIEEREGEWDG